MSVCSRTRSSFQSALMTVVRRTLASGCFFFRNSAALALIAGSSDPWKRSRVRKVRAVRILRSPSFCQVGDPLLEFYDRRGPGFHLGVIGGELPGVGGLDLLHQALGVAQDVVKLLHLVVIR